MNSHPLIILAYALALAFLQAICPAREPVVGKIAPPLAFDALLNAPEGQVTSWKALKGKLVVLDFWFIGCGPCMASFPHVRQLAAELKDEDVAFVFITFDESESQVREFLKENPLPGWVGLDSTMSVINTYAIEGFPTAALVGPDGNFLGYFQLHSVTAAQLREQAKSAKPLDFLRSYNSSQVEVPADPWEDPNTLVQVLVTKASEPIGRTSANGSRLRARGIDAKALYSRITGLDASRFRGNIPEGTDVYDVVSRFRRTGGDRDIYAATQKAFDAAIGVRTEMKKSREIVTVLKFPEVVPPIWQLEVENMSAVSMRWKDGELHLGNFFPVFLARTISQRLGEPVEFDATEEIQETRFDCSIPLPEDYTTEQLLQALEAHMGIKTVREERAIDVLVFEPNGD